MHSFSKKAREARRNLKRSVSSGAILSKGYRPGSSAKKDDATAPYRGSVLSQGVVGATRLVQDCGDTVISVALSHDGLVFAAGGASKVASVYDVGTGDLVASFSVAAGINAVVFSGDDESTLKLLVGTFGGMLHCFSVPNKTESDSQKVGGGEAVLCMAAAQGLLTVGGQSSKLHLYAIPDGSATLLSLLLVLEHSNGPMLTLAPQPSLSEWPACPPGSQGPPACRDGRVAHARPCAIVMSSRRQGHAGRALSAGPRREGRSPPAEA